MTNAARIPTGGDDPRRTFRFGPRSSRVLALSGIGVAALMASLVKISFTAQWQGLYLLHGNGGGRLELKDDLYLGDGSRLIAGVSFSRFRRFLDGSGSSRGESAWLEGDWEEATGSGSISNHVGGGVELLTMFGRYVDDFKKAPKGLFVGGAPADVSEDVYALNRSGMSLRRGLGWNHVWCTVNEAIVDVSSSRASNPSDWTFLGSSVIIRDRKRAVIESSHEINIGGTTLHMKRFAYFRAGVPGFELGIRLMNVGDKPLLYSYYYGDEPWVGTFGRGDTNFGWIEGEILRNVTPIDTKRNRWAGIYDSKTRIANVIAWTGDDLPDFAHISDGVSFAPESVGKPLSSNTPFIGLQWRNRRLLPGQSRSMMLAIGLAAWNTTTGLPTAPADLVH